MTGTIATIPKYQFLDSLGVPLVNGTLTTYLTGTTTLTSTWQDQAQASLNTNPIVLDARGEATLWLDSAIVYKFVLKNEAGAVQWTQENISGSSSSTVTLTNLLLAQSGSNSIGFTQAEAGAVARTLQSKNRDIAHRLDFDSDVNFNSAKGSKPNVDSSSNFNAKIKPLREPAQINLDESVLSAPTSGRGNVLYGAAAVGSASASVLVNAPRVVHMAGFRLAGRWSKGRAPLVPNSASNTATVLIGSGRLDIGAPASNLGCEITPHLNQWYAVFACSNPGDATVSYKLMPFFRAKSIASSTITLNFAGEDQYGTLGGFTPVGAYYDWQPPAIAGTPDFPGYNFTAASNGLVGCDVLVCSETINGRPNLPSGRITTVTANTKTTVTLASIGGMGVVDSGANFNGDFFLVAPPGFTDYVYLASFLYEPGGSGYVAPSYTSGVISSGKLGGGDVRNIADSGTVVRSRGGNLADPNFVATGTVASPGIRVRFCSAIPPLATAVFLTETSSYATATIGSVVTNFNSDGSLHTQDSFYFEKVSTGTETAQSPCSLISFSFSQEAYIIIAGSIASLRSGGKLLTSGWLEN